MLAHHRQDLGSGCVFYSRGLGDDGAVRPGGAPVAPGVRVFRFGVQRLGVLGGLRVFASKGLLVTARQCVSNPCGEAWGPIRPSKNMAGFKV